MTTRFKVGSATDKGQLRSDNQDSKLIADGRSLFAVADGMGGHRGGEVASALALEVLESSVEEPTQVSLVTAVELANTRVHSAAADDPELRGMGTTLCAIALVETDDGDEEIAWVNVGDSRIYLFRDDGLLQLSTDHSLVEDLRRDGQLTDEEAAVHPQRNILTRALGIDTEVQVDSRTIIPYTGDRFLLCSDGLFNEVTLDQITATLRRLADPREAADELVRQANDHGGRDNITAVIVDVVDDGGRSVAASAALADEPGTVDSTETYPVVERSDPDREPAMAGFGVAGSAPAATSDHDQSIPALAADGEPRPDDDLPFGRSTDDLYGDLDQARSRHFTWRVLAFVVAVLLVLGVAGGAVGWYAKRTYFVGFASSRVAVYQGQPGGLLFFDPSVKFRTDLTRTELTPAEAEAVGKEQTFGSLADARSFANNLREIVRDRQAQSTTTSTTTTTTTTTRSTTSKTTAASGGQGLTTATTRP